MIDAGIEEGVPANWGRVQQAYQAIVGQIPRTAPRQAFAAIAGEERRAAEEAADPIHPLRLVNKLREATGDDAIFELHREMGCTREEFVGWLPKATQHAPLQMEHDRAVVRAGAMTVEIAFTPAPPRGRTRSPSGGAGSSGSRRPRRTPRRRGPAG